MLLRPRVFNALVYCILTLSVGAGSQVVGAEEKYDEAAITFFENSIRPVLVKRCYECHGPDAVEPKGGLRVSSRSALLAGGDTGPAIAPGDAKNSLLIDSINYGDLYQMPPASKMPVEEIALLAKWIDSGAAWPAEDLAPQVVKKAFDLQERAASHWAWRPVVDPPVPPTVDQGWAKDPLDQFLLAKIESAGLQPAAPATKRALLRRAYFDLIGLPPTPEQLQAFLQDDSPNAFAQVVDELLDSPHFGERWGRHWLDLVRYAESRGHEFDYTTPNAWQYRDYVIRALNADTPYDQFVKEHIAGDLLEQPRTDAHGANQSILGPGFWHLGEWVHSPVDIRKDETDRFDNMIDVFSKTFLGLTVSCARCHDHKFDAISQADYYALAGFLQSSEYRQVRFDTLAQNTAVAEQLQELNRPHRQAIAREGIEAFDQKQFAAYLLAARQVLQSKPQQPAKAKLVDFEKAADAVALVHDLDAARLLAWVDHLRSVAPGDVLHPWTALALQGELADPAWKQAVEAEAGRFPALAAGDVLTPEQTIADYRQGDAAFWQANGPTFGAGPLSPGDLKFDAEGTVEGVATWGCVRREPAFNRLELAPDADPEGGRLGKWEIAGRTFRTPTFIIGDGPVQWLARGSGRVQLVVDSHRMINGPLHGALAKEFSTGDKLAWTSVNLGVYQGHGCHLEFSAKGDEPLEVYLVTQGADAPRPLPGVAWQEVLTEHGASPASLAAGYAQQFADALSALAEPADVSTAQAEAGDWLQRHRPLWNAATESPAVDALRTARQKTSGQIVVRSRLAPSMWDGDSFDEQLLIRGNSRTPGDRVPRRLLTGIAGEQPRLTQGSGRLALAERVVDPSNPFVSRVMTNRIWSHLFGRGIVPSPDNFGLLGQPPTHPELLDHLSVRFMADGWSIKRLVRAIMLSSAYQMSTTPDPAGERQDPQNLLWRRANLRRLEGETIRDAVLAVSGRLEPAMFGPPTPVHLTAFMQGRGRPGSGPIDGAGRRSIYLSVRRNFLSPWMQAFDVPQPFSTVGRRSVSNVPAQALILMNDPFIVEQAGLWAKRLLDEADTAEERIEQMYVEGLCRLPTADEKAASLTFLQQQNREYGLRPEQAANDLRAWTDLCHVLFNVKEFIFY
ncbi:PSD1 and planctomycete cytochrome C domain-containing protein [Lignipirellula cremea]|uniref:Planctomycete cytochrome C n=1 Tax=Lignipirellula cremea TaxID=2528010 RepID=A0A518DPL6_9BACT|nr:PSD1 and planctomycete cytochrome C domain-containing protein [Lignipirellula cremea]QDU93774.1 Planctomycete cytochrome C [Lignipirellula cremea]